MKDLTRKDLKELAKLKIKKYRKEQKKVIIEGKRAVQQIIDNNIKIYKIITSGENIVTENIPDGFDDIIFKVSRNDLTKLTSSENPQSILAVIDIPKLEIVKNDFLLYLDGIQDPGNLGTIMRTALAAGVDGVILSPECCELFNPKVIRSSLGAVFTMPTLIRNQQWLLEQKAIKISTVLENAKNLFEWKPKKNKYILIIGSEANGISKNIIQNSEIKLTIPMSNKMESLNAAVSAAICMFELKHKIE
jgi:TrmH family RNA methyltransferase